MCVCVCGRSVSGTTCCLGNANCLWFADSQWERGGQSGVFLPTQGHLQHAHRPGRQTCKWVSERNPAIKSTPLHNKSREMTDLCSCPAHRSLMEVGHPECTAPLGSLFQACLRSRYFRWREDTEFVHCCWETRSRQQPLLWLAWFQTSLYLFGFIKEQEHLGVFRSFLVQVFECGASLAVRCAPHCGVWSSWQTLNRPPHKDSLCRLMFTFIKRGGCLFRDMRARNADTRRVSPKGQSYSRMSGTPLSWSPENVPSGHCCRELKKGKSQKAYAVFSFFFQKHDQLFKVENC